MITVIAGLIRLLLRPFGYLAFTLALVGLSATARLLGERHELGYFARRLADSIRRYPEVTRRGVQTAWATWTLLFIFALSPMSPTSWDEVALGVLALIVVLLRFAGGQRASH